MSTTALGRMRYRGVRSIEATCAACGHQARILVDMLADELPVSDVALMLRCLACGSKNVTTRPDWHAQPARDAGHIR